MIRQRVHTSFAGYARRAGAQPGRNWLIVLVVSPFRLYQWLARAAQIIKILVAREKFAQGAHRRVRPGTRQVCRSAPATEVVFPTRPAGNATGNERGAVRAAPQEIVKKRVSINQGRRESVNNMNVVGLFTEHVAEDQRGRAPNFEPGWALNLGAEVRRNCKIVSGLVASIMRRASEGNPVGARSSSLSCSSREDSGDPATHRLSRSGPQCAANACSPSRIKSLVRKSGCSSLA